MEELCKVLVWLFRYVSPDEMISSLDKTDKPYARPSYILSPDIVEKLYYTYDSQSDEADNKRKVAYLSDQTRFMLREEVGKKVGKKESGLDVFDLLEVFNRLVLGSVHEEVTCRFEYLQCWRDVTCKIDAGIFAAAKYAEIDLENGKVRNTFTWKPLIGNNNAELNTILSKGISDNHFHLFGSVYYFDLSWLNLMNEVNRPETIERLRQMDKNRRSLRSKRNAAEQENSLIQKHLQAALIRLYLYSELTGRKIQLGKYKAPWSWLLRYVLSNWSVENLFGQCKRIWEEEGKQNIQDFIEKFRTELQEYCPEFFWLLSHVSSEFWEEPFSSNMGRNTFSYQEFLEAMKNNLLSLEEVPLEECAWLFQANGFKLFEQEWRKQTRVALRHLLMSDDLLSCRNDLQQAIDGFLILGGRRNRDYAMNAAGSWYDTEWSNAQMIGERWLMYTMFRRHGRLQERWNDSLFYAYLVIKESFHMELQQNNGRIGFTNFGEYQRRKGWFTTRYTDAELARIAVDMVFENQPVQSLELRIKPKMTCLEDVEMIERYDKEITKMGRDKDSFYYVFHFAKEKEPKPKEEEFNNMYYRHYELRRKIRDQSIALMEFRKRNPRLAQRVRGIDACSDEDGCRPEVFATAYRVLRHHSCYQGLSLEPEVPQLRMTYHVGEVFQDIVDGLRAIDEAVHFLNLDCGDRLGHATVLGLHVHKWYQENNHFINIRRQDYLDNVVWLYQKLVDYRISGQEALLEYLKSEYLEYFSLIYGKVLNRAYLDNISKNACLADKEYGNGKSVLHYEFDINTYFYSWMLRGDHPRLYSRGYYKHKPESKNLWELYGINQVFPKEKRVRYILPAVMLNHFYHYNEKIKELGSQTIQVRIPANMVEGISLVQKGMQKKIARKGIGIETNPSSNLLISSIESYSEHPIIQFYNRGLTDDPEKLAACAQINVSINTDDQGVFATHLSNEYALMASALGQQRNEMGQYLYRRSDILEWIKEVQEMGNNQSFLKKGIMEKQQDKMEAMSWKKEFLGNLFPQNEE